MNEERRNPFPGLRPFEYHEYELFFGREEQYEEMIVKLSETRFLAVVGTSGSGKSSLVKAGLLPALYGGLMMSAGPSWRIAVFRPKDDPIREMALALNHNRVFGDRSKTNGSSNFKLSESTNWSNLCAKIVKEADEKERNPSSRVLEVLSADNRTVVSSVTQDGDSKDRSKIVQAFNGILKLRDFYRVDDFRGVPFASEVRELLARDQDSLTEQEVQKLNRLLLESSFPQEIANKIESQAQITEVGLRRGDLGLIEVAREAKMAKDENLLVVVDQFEELFRYARISENGPHGNQAAAFVKLLLQASAQTDIPIYVVLTMRSDYLGDCAKFWGLPEAINKGQYLIPRLTRDQRREAIQGPIGLRGATITPQLVNQLLNDMGDDPDQLPILQHALMRTWDQWEKTSSYDEPIDMSHYVAIGKMAEALSIHADEAYEELPDEHSREIAERIFRCLAERGTGHSEIRRPTRISELLDITGATFKELNTVLNVFRKEGRSFLLPAARKPLRRETLIDISHESLIRNWKRSKDWIKEEAESAMQYRRLVESAKLYEQHKAGMPSDLEIQSFLNWKKGNKPNLAWASRYHPDVVQAGKQDPTQNGQEVVITAREIFDGAMGFLERSHVASKRRQRNRKLTKIFVAAVILLILALPVAFLLWQARNAELQRLRTRLTYNTQMNFAQRQLEAGNFVDANRLLRESNDLEPKQNFSFLSRLNLTNKVTALRDFEWWYLWKRSRDEEVTLDEYDDDVIALAYLSDSKTVAVASRNGIITLWDATQRQVLATPEGIPANPTVVAFASDRTNIVIAQQDGSIGLWQLSNNLQTATLQRTLRNANRAPVNTIAYSPDNSVLAFATLDGLVTVQRAAEDGPLFVIPPKALSSISLAFSPDSQFLAVGQGQTVTVFNVTTRQPDFSIDLNTTVPKEVLTRNPLAAPITCLAFSPDQTTLAIGTRDNSIMLWDTIKHTYLVALTGPSLPGQSQEVMAVAFSSKTKGVMASASADGSIKIWNVEPVSNPESRKNLNDQKTPAGSRAADQISQDLLLRTLNGHAGPVTSVAFLANQETIVSGSDDNTVKLWAMTTNQATVELRSGSSASISSLAFSTDGKWLAAGKTDSSLEVWNTSNGQPIKPLLNPHPSATPIGMPIAFSSEGVLAAATVNNSVKLWQMKNPEEGQKEFERGHSAAILALAFSPDGKWLATGGADRTVRLWNVETSKSSVIKEIKSEAVLSLAFSPKSAEKILAIATTRDVILFDVDRNKDIADLNKHHDVISSVAFSPDGEMVATGSWDKTAKVWNAHTGEELLTLHGHTQKILSISFFQSGKRLVTASEDASVRLWDTSPGDADKATRSPLLTLRDLRSGINSAVATFEGRTLATGNADGTVLLRYGASDQEIKRQDTALAQHLRSPK